MSSLNKKYIFAGIVLGLFLLLSKAKTIFFPKEEQSTYTFSKTESSKDHTKINNPQPSIQPQTSLPSQQPSIQSNQISTSTVNDYLEIARESSQKEVEKFENTALLKVKLPRDFQFSQQDSDDGMIGIIGRKQNSKQIYGLLARQGVSTNEEVEKFIPELAQRIPGVSTQLVNEKISPEMYEVAADSPFKNVYTWQVQNNSNVLYLIKADRKDGLGSYMIFTTGPNKESQQTEKDLENIISSIQLTSPPK